VVPVTGGFVTVKRVAGVVADGVIIVGVVAAGLVVVGVAVPQAVIMKAKTNKITRGIVNLFNSNLLTLLIILIPFWLCHLPLRSH